MGTRRHRFLRGLVASEVALALVLLISGGLMMKSYTNLKRVDPGFESSGILVATMNLHEKSYPSRQQKNDFVRRLEERFMALNGVISVGCTTLLPFSGSNSNNTIAIQGQPDPGPGNYALADNRSITATYPEAMGIPLLRGQTFTSLHDKPEAPVALINDAMAKRHWPDKDPIGKRFKIGNLESEAPWITVIGVLGDVRHLGFDSKPRPEFCLPYAQAPWRQVNLVLRTTGEPVALTSAIRQVVAQLDPNQAIVNVETMESIMNDSAWMNRFNTVLFGALAGIALLLATVGLYGVISYSVSQRTHEIGLRMALGADPANVRNLVVWQGFRLTLAGIVVGLPAAFGLTRLMQSLLYEVSTSDPLTFAAIPTLLMAVSLAASYIPARRATRIDPYTALRCE